MQMLLRFHARDALSLIWICNKYENRMCSIALSLCNVYADNRKSDTISVPTWENYQLSTATNRSYILSLKGLRR